MVETSDGTTVARRHRRPKMPVPQGTEVWLTPAAERCRALTDDKKPTGGRDDTAKTFQARHAAGRAESARPRWRSEPCSPLTVRAAAPPAEAITPQLIEAAQEGRQGGLVHRDRPVGRGKDRQAPSRRNIRHRGAGRTHRRRAAVPAHRPGICQQRPRRRCRQLVRRRASASRGSDRAWLAALRARRRRASITRPSTADPDGTYAGFRAHAERRSPTTPTLVKAEDAPDQFRRICSIPNGTARSSRPIPGYSGTILTATFELVRDIGWELLRTSSRSRTSCRCSRRPIRRRSWRSASAA